MIRSCLQNFLILFKDNVVSNRCTHALLQRVSAQNPSRKNLFVSKIPPLAEKPIPLRKRMERIPPLAFVGVDLCQHCWHAGSKWSCSCRVLLPRDFYTYVDLAIALPNFRTRPVSSLTLNTALLKFLHKMQCELRPTPRPPVRHHATRMLFFQLVVAFVQKMRFQMEDATHGDPQKMSPKVPLKDFSADFSEQKPLLVFRSTHSLYRRGLYAEKTKLNHVRI